MAIEPLGKPRGIWCEHARKSNGCGIYASRPTACASFRCLWLDGQIPAYWKPSKSRMVVHGLEQTIVVDVDPGMPNAWRGTEYYRDLKQWSERVYTGAPTDFKQIFVCVGDLVWAIFPPEDLLLGVIKAGVPVEVGIQNGEGWIQPFAKIFQDGGFTELRGQRWNRQST